MKAVDEARTALDVRFRAAPRRVRLWVAGIEGAAVVSTALALVLADPRRLDWEYFAVLLALSVIFEEGSRSVGRVRLLTGAGARSDVSTVWTLTGALVLDPGVGALLALLIHAYAWARRGPDRRTWRGRSAYAAAVAMLAVLAAGLVVPVQLAGRPMPFKLASTAVVVAAVLVYALLERALTSAAALLSAGRWSRAAVLGRLDENGVQLATLCLGCVTAQVLVERPLLAVLTVVPLMLIQRAAVIRQLEEAASTDQKTQLLTPWAWRQRAQRRLAGGLGSTAALLVLDLDEFKSVNDLHGHLIGDAALFAASARITAELRPTDVVGRFGGEEFVVLLPGLGADAARAVAERLRARIGAIRLAELQASHADGRPCEHLLSASIGVAVYPQDGGDLPALLHAADGALYAAKRAGRDRVASADRGRGAAARADRPDRAAHAEHADRAD